ncbi:hypothetical protein LIER_04113 [Lithospermum erythrorhizon]|uniref:PB1-like domain-containing protein n=1 Tax=Lithospermum erythrorhizon TaxID=34254 RepID=A0AAV3NVJ7_LITER
MAGQIHEKGHPDYNDEAFRVLYCRNRNLFSVRLHYKGRFVSNPKLSYVDGKVEYFDYYDSNTSELGLIESFAFRAGLLYDEFALCVYQDPDVEGLNGIRCLKFPKNIVKLVNLTSDHNFIDVYFVGSDNTDSFDDIHDEYGNLKISEASTEFLKAKSIERARLSVITTNLVDHLNNEGVVDNSRVVPVDGPMNNGEVVGDGNMNNEDVVGDENLMNEDSEKSNSEEEDDKDDDKEDEAFDVEDLQFGLDEDCNDDGGLGGYEEVIDPEQAAHEAYSYNLKDWFSEMNSIVPVIQAQPLMISPQTSLQPTLA